MDIYLVITHAPPHSGLEGRSHSLRPGKNIIGRGASCDLVLQDSDRVISSQHLVLELENDQAFAIDQSTNGTKLNSPDNTLVKHSRQHLQTNDALYIGDYRLELQVEDKPCRQKPDLGGGFIDSMGQNVTGTENLGMPGSSTETSVDDLDKWLLPPMEPESEIQSPLPESHDHASSLLGEVSGQQKVVDPLDILGVSSGPGTNGKEALPEDDLWWIDTTESDPEVLDNALQPPFPSQKPAAEADLHSGYPKPHASAPADAGITSGSGVSDLPKKLGVPERNASELEDELVKTISIVAERLIGILRARSSMKNEMRVQRTIVGSIENNPLKFTANGQDALKLMFGSTTSGFTDGPASMREAIGDLEDHQVATLLGIKAAYTFMLQRFDPETIALQAESFGTVGRMSLGGKGRLWDFYSAHYRNLMADPEATYNQMFGDILSREYDEQIKALRKKREQ